MPAEQQMQTAASARRYFFDIEEDGAAAPDAVGSRFSCVDDARREAARAIVEMARDLELAATPEHQLVLRLRDEAGAELLGITLTLTVRGV